MPEQIHVDDDGALAAEFADVKRPRSVPAELMTVPLEAVQEHVLHGIKLGPLAKVAAMISDASKFRVAAWLWLRPDQPRSMQEHLVDLQRKVGLGHVNHRTFCEKLIDRCRDLQGKKPKLTRFTEGRIAEIEFKIATPMPGDDASARGFERLQAALVAASDQRSPQLALIVLRNALSQASAVVKHAIVGPSQTSCSYDANLMVPSATRPGDDVTAVGARAARRLWGELADDRSVQQFFVVVDEAPFDPPTYRGFWIPDARHSNTPMPGAPRAYFYRAPQAVFADHLPRLPIDDEELLGRWKAYFHGNTAGFLGSFFVSLPVLDLDHANPVAVVNVNIRDETPWYRVLSRAWLNRAAQLAAPWTTTAWHAFNLAWMLDRSHLQGCEPRKVAAFVPKELTQGVDSARKLPRGG